MFLPIFTKIEENKTADSGGEVMLEELKEDKRKRKDPNTNEASKNARIHSDFQEEKVMLQPYLEKWITKSQNIDPKRFYCKLCGLGDKKYKEPYWDFIIERTLSFLGYIRGTGTCGVHS